MPLENRELVKEITLDMAANMQLAARLCFPQADLVTDRFHVVKLILEALQHWEEIEKENQAIKTAKEKQLKHVPFKFDNEDTPKQVLARCRYILAKKPDQWTENQQIRANLLFDNYPLLHKAYKHTLEIYMKKRIKT